MISGHNLDRGDYPRQELNTDEIWQKLSVLFSSRSKNSASYKFGFFKSILDNLYNVDDNLVLTFDQLFGKFAEIYWNLVTKYNIAQMPVGKNAAVVTVIRNFVVRNNISEGIPFESLTDQQKLDLQKRVKNKCKINVVGALYGDTSGIFYAFDKKEEWIRINPQVYTYVCKRKSALEKINYYEWAKYLEKINSGETTNNLLSKLDESSRRSNLSIYRQILFDEFETKECFYCGRPLKGRGIEVDHFIPWAFIKDDKLWNLVLACRDCNNKKRDKLAKDIYLEKITTRNKLIQLHYYKEKLGEYSQAITLESSAPLGVNASGRISNIVDNVSDLKAAQDMLNYRKDGLESIYLYAKENGYDEIWQPKGFA